MLFYVDRCGTLSIGFTYSRTVQYMSSPESKMLQICTYLSNTVLEKLLWNFYFSILIQAIIGVGRKEQFFPLEFFRPLSHWALEAKMVLR